MTEDYAPVKVHIASSDVHEAPKKNRRLVTIYKTIVLTASNPYQQLVPENPNRYSFQITAGQAAGTLLTSDLIISGSVGDISRVAGIATPLSVAGKFLPAQSLGYTSQAFYGVNPVWIAASAASPTYPIYVGVAENVWQEDE